MINKVKKLMLVFIIFLAFGCSVNKFKKEGQIRSITYGLLGYDDYKFCKAKIPNFIGKYPSGKNPSRICNRYQYYTCHITYYCPKLSNDEERKKCEQDANDYWLPQWDNAKGDSIKKAEISKKVCNSEASKNNQPPQ